MSENPYSPPETVAVKRKTSIIKRVYEEVTRSYAGLCSLVAATAIEVVDIAVTQYHWRYSLASAVCRVFGYQIERLDALGTIAFMACLVVFPYFFLNIIVFTMLIIWLRWPAKEG